MRTYHVRDSSVQFPQNNAVCCRFTVKANGGDLMTRSLTELFRNSGQMFH